MKTIIILALLLGCTPEQTNKPIYVRDEQKPPTMPMINRIIDKDMGYVIYVDHTGRLYPCPILRKLEQNVRYE